MFKYNHINILTIHRSHSIFNCDTMLLQRFTLTAFRYPTVSEYYFKPNNVAYYLMWLFGKIIGILLIPPNHNRTRIPRFKHRSFVSCSSMEESATNTEGLPPRFISIHNLITSKLKSTKHTNTFVENVERLPEKLFIHPRFHIHFRASRSQEKVFTSPSSW